MKPAITLAVVSLVAILIWILPANAQTLPSVVDPNARYLFYLHGGWLGQRGKHESHPRYGVRYEFDDIVAALEKRGFKVISEIREGGVRPGRYARRLANLVDTLIGQGVPAKNISVIGHSKGGQITLQTSARLGNPAVNFLIMASCAPQSSPFRRSYARFLERGAHRLSGRVLSLYDREDRVGGSCREAFDLGSPTESKELVLQTGRGHGLFYTADKAWVDQVVAWTQR